MDTAVYLQGTTAYSSCKSYHLHCLMQQAQRLFVTAKPASSLRSVGALRSGDVGGVLLRERWSCYRMTVQVT